MSPITHCLAISKNKASTLLHFETLKRNLAHPRAACVYSRASDDPIDDCSDSRHIVIVNADSYSTHYTSIIHWCIVLFMMIHVLPTCAWRKLLLTQEAMAWVMMIHGWTTCIRSYIMHRSLSSPMQCIIRSLSAPTCGTTCIDCISYIDRTSYIDYIPYIDCISHIDLCPHPCSASFDRLLCHAMLCLIITTFTHVVLHSIAVCTYVWHIDRTSYIDCISYIDCMSIL